MNIERYFQRPFFSEREFLPPNESVMYKSFYISLTLPEAFELSCENVLFTEFIKKNIELVYDTYSEKYLFFEPNLYLKPTQSGVEITVKMDGYEKIEYDEKETQRSDG